MADWSFFYHAGDSTSGLFGLRIKRGPGNDTWVGTFSGKIDQAVLRVAKFSGKNTSMSIGLPNFREENTGLCILLFFSINNREGGLATNGSEAGLG
ncbi:hypothetical protein XELAEV_18023233mg [Xenopus laevis]|uniref:Uncharacterized protein n=1 Tax=Xenopus laevis TaxID=8355 RepID=A0A974HNW8_XENLA|nr:hypothetical protein XELAEV_18023233mg [Xenopus laevis]